MNRLAVTIKEARIKAGLTEKDLAQKCGLSISYILQVESGKKIINESIADKILKTLGTKEEFINEDRVTEKPKNIKQTPKIHEKFIVEPNQSWSSALAGVIEKYPIYEQSTKKIVGYKELPIINKKVEGHKPDKLMFIKCSCDDMDYFRIKKNDVVTLFSTKDIQNFGLYLVEIKGKRLIRQVVKEGNKKISLSKRSNDTTPIKGSLDNIKVIGKVIKNEFLI